jgi:hypothetical protein
MAYVLIEKSDLHCKYFHTIQLALHPTIFFNFFNKLAQFKPLHTLEKQKDSLYWGCKVEDENVFSAKKQIIYVIGKL